MSGLSIIRSARIALAALPDFRRTLRLGAAFEEPAISVRDPWPSDPANGARLMRGELTLGGSARLILPEGWTQQIDDDLREAAHSFTWLRDLRALGTDGARSRARLLVSTWLDTARPDPFTSRADIIGARLSAWIGHYDFFAASADEEFRSRLMTRIHNDTRALAARIPGPAKDGRTLRAIKGLTASAVAIPDGNNHLRRVLKLMPGLVAEQILPDGSHCERSPLAQLQALQDLVEIRNLFQMAGLPPQPYLTAAIERAAFGLGTLRHLDGGLALFNGSREEDPALIDFVLGQAKRPVRGHASQPVAGFRRLQAGRSLLMIDAGSPPPPGTDRLTHAGTLSFELSIGRDRLVVNCGASLASGRAWADAMRSTAAHSTLAVEDTNSFPIGENKGSRRPLNLHVQAEEANGAQWLEVSHDGYMKTFNATHRRRLYMAESGEDIRGEDILETPTPRAFSVRFHLHPAVSAMLQHDTALLRLPSGGLWRLRIDSGTPTLEESVYLGGPDRQETQQIVVTSDAEGPQSIKWAITKVG